MENYSERLPSKLAARLVMALTSEDIADCYAWGKEMADQDDRCLNLLLFCILASLCSRYIKQKHLEKTDMEFQNIIGTLARLSGLFQRDEKALSYNEILKIFNVDEEIPADIDLGCSGDGRPEYVLISRFIDVMLVANYILEDYESSMPSEQFENLTPEQFEHYFACKRNGVENLLESARRTVIKVAELKMVGKVFRERWLHGEQPIRKDDDEFPFEL